MCVGLEDTLLLFSVTLSVRTPRRVLEGVADRQRVYAKIGLQFSEYTELRYQGTRERKTRTTAHGEGGHFPEKADCRLLRQEHYEGGSLANVRNIPGSDIDERDVGQQMNRIVISENEAPGG